MSWYRFEAMSQTGEVVRGTLDVASASEAVERVRQMGLFLTRLAEVRPERGLLGWIKRLLGLSPAPVPLQPPAHAGSPGASGSPQAWVVSWGAGQPQAPGDSPTPPPGRRSFDLDAGDFLPIARDELKREARDVRAWGSPWFGRRDIIPPADDPRTKLIDRGLVTEGLLSQEQLIEIHTVGDEMQRHRGALQDIAAQAAAAGQAAVELDREQRRLRKEQKKKEAQERKERRQAEIAHRRATDIIYLGRGVSGRLNERESDGARLTALGLPVLQTPADIAKALGLTIPQLRGLAFHCEVAPRIHYVTFTVPKRSGGVRTLSAPHRRLKGAQCWILDEILRRLPVTPAAHGFIQGRSIVTNAQPHCGQAVVVNLDLENFFPSITFPRVSSVFWRLGYSPCVATILALLCTECPRQLVQYDGKPYWVATGPRGLPQGACTSPALSNQVAQRLDRRLQGLAQRLGWTCTRYADDLTFSGHAGLTWRVGYLMARVRHIAEDEGFVLNEKKSRVLKPNAAQMVTGLVVNRHPAVRRHERRRLRALFHHARREGLNRQNRVGSPDFRAALRGAIAFIGMVQPALAQRLRDELNGVRD